MSTLNKKLNKKNFNKSVETFVHSMNVMNDFSSSLLTSPVEETVEVVDNDVSLTTIESEIEMKTEEQIEEKNDSPVDEFQEKVLEMVKEMGWEGVYNKLTVKSTVVTKEGTKMSKAVVIYQEMISQKDIRRIDIIKQFMSQLDMSKEGASTYFQSIKTKINNL